MLSPPHARRVKVWANGNARKRNGETWPAWELAGPEAAEVSCDRGAVLAPTPALRQANNLITFLQRISCTRSFLLSRNPVKGFFHAGRSSACCRWKARASAITWPIVGSFRETARKALLIVGLARPISSAIFDGGRPARTPAAILYSRAVSISKPFRFEGPSPSIY